MTSGKITCKDAENIPPDLVHWLHHKVIARLGVDGIHIQQHNKACLNTMQHLSDMGTIFF